MKRKKILAMILTAALIFSLAACGNDDGGSESRKYDGVFGEYVDALDEKFARDVIDEISALGDDPDTGNRSAGSPAEKEAADYIEKTMEDIGLENVTRDKITVDGWTYKGANLTFKNSDGEKQKVILGGYATHLVAENEKTEVVYLGQGTAADYEGVDVKDKLVLIDIDQNNEWWITYPAYQAKLKGAKAVLAMSIMEEEDADRLGSQDICGPKDAPAFAISQSDSEALQKAIRNNDGESVKVTFNADSRITEDTDSQNIWGEIPGKTDDVVYVISHYDGYYHSSFDDASGVGGVLAIAKAIIDSGYEPEKTIRFISHGAEEWGKTDYEADWAIGAWEQIKNVHPEWAEDAFALINLDGSYTLEGVTDYGIETSQELTMFAQNTLGEMIDSSEYEITWTETPNPYREDFGYSRMGIPAIAATDEGSDKYYAYSYHQSTDSIDAVGFNDDAYKFIMELYGKLIYEFDSLPVRPVQFTERFGSFMDSFDEDIFDDEELFTTIEEHRIVASAIISRVNELNQGYMSALEAEDQEKADEIKKEAEELNTELYEAYKMIQDEFLRLNWWHETIFPHENAQSNIAAINEALTALEGGDAEAALDSIYGIEFAYYASAFDKETCDYFIDRLTKEKESGGSWNEGLVENEYSGIDDVVRALLEKIDAGGKDFSAEITALNTIKATQEGYIKNFAASEKASLEKVFAKLVEIETLATEMSVGESSNVQIDSESK